MRAGHGDRAEASEAGSRVANAQALVIEAQARLEDAKTLFRTVVGRMPGRLKSAPGARKALPRTLAIAIQEARRAAPSVVATEHDAVAARAAIGSAYSRLYPKLNLEISGDAGRGLDGRGDRDVDARAMLVVRWTLFNGGINRARISEARARADEAGSIAANTRRQVEQQTRVSWTAMTAAGVRVPVLKRRLTLLRKTRAAYSSQFMTGERRLLDLLDAQNEIFLADAALRTEIFVGQYNAYRVLASMGQLVWALGLELPSEAVRPHRRSVLDGWSARVSPHQHVDAGPHK